MKELLCLIVAMPLAGSLIMTIAGSKLSRVTCACIGVGSIGLSCIIALLVGFDFLHNNPDCIPYNQVLWQWVSVYGFSPNIAFTLDTVSLTFIFVVTFVGTLIHLYSVPFMWKDEGFVRSLFT